VKPYALTSAESSRDLEWDDELRWLRNCSSVECCPVQLASPTIRTLVEARTARPGQREFRYAVRTQFGRRTTCARCAQPGPNLDCAQPKKPRLATISNILCGKAPPLLPTYSFDGDISHLNRALIGLEITDFQGKSNEEALVGALAM
jgi:hypothetical protein